ncbi:MAG: hypothetical protein KJO13_11590 [Gammaproteobacteria bacterium]|nr:hypothetical protein [Gammaproteobacteria bacterium]
MPRWTSVVVFLVLFLSLPAAAQKSGQSATVTLGIVQSAERVTLQSTGGGKGAAVGGTVGAVAGGRRGAIIGGTTGALLSRSGTSEGMQYAVKVGNGSVIVVVSDQTQIQIGDCVSVEQQGDTANIRRQDQMACENSAAAQSPAVQEEFNDAADKCAEAQRNLLDASTKEELELATAVASILCE